MVRCGAPTQKAAANGRKRAMAMLWQSGMGAEKPSAISRQSLAGGSLRRFRIFLIFSAAVWAALHRNSSVIHWGCSEPYPRRGWRCWRTGRPEHKPRQKLQLARPPTLRALAAWHSNTRPIRQTGGPAINHDDQSSFLCKAIWGVVRSAECS